MRHLFGEEQEQEQRRSRISIAEGARYDEGAKVYLATVRRILGRNLLTLSQIPNRGIELNLRELSF